MSDEFSLRAEMARGERVSSFTETEEFKRVVSELAEHYAVEVMKDRNSLCWERAQVLLDVVNDLKQIVVTGSMAAQQLKRNR